MSGFQTTSTTDFKFIDYSGCDKIQVSLCGKTYDLQKLLEILLDAYLPFEDTGNKLKLKRLGDLLDTEEE